MLIRRFCPRRVFCILFLFSGTALFAQVGPENPVPPIEAIPPTEALPPAESVPPDETTPPEESAPPPDESVPPETQLPEEPEDDPFDIDSLFGGDEELVSELDQDSQEENPAEELQKREGIEWGGRFRTELDFRFQWDDYMSEPGRIHDRTYVDPFLETYLFFDARPKTNFRVFGKFVIQTDRDTTLSQLETTFGINPEDATIVNNNDGTFSVGFEESDENSYNELNRVEPVSAALSFGVQEMFADFNWQEKLYFRIGKSFVKWGVGYFFSPADVINPEMIDFEDPSEDRSGPMFFRMHYPFKEHNLYLYLLTDTVEEIEDVGFALNMSFLVKNVELSAGAHYQIKKSPKFTFTVSAPLKDVKLFAEGMLSIGSDRIYVRPSKNQPDTETDDDGNEVLPYHALDTYTLGWKPVFSGTAGLLYLNQDHGITLVGQYYFNGEGYRSFRFEDGTSLLQSAAYLVQNPNSNGLYKDPGERQADYMDPANLDIADLMFFGQHYIALSFMANDIKESGVSLWSYWIGAMSDLSGIYSFELSYKVIEFIEIAGGFRLSYGAAGTEFADPMALFLQSETNLEEPTADFYLTFRIAGGNF